MIGIDEVGRGPLAGPVVSCACIYFAYNISADYTKHINDSKKLSYSKRIESFKLISKSKREKRLNYSIGFASVAEIDKLNILNATILSMKRAVKKLKINNGTIIVDGNIKLKNDNDECISLIKGDEKSISIATASIVAKVHRDRYMKIIGKNFPYFNWEKNAGYGTKEHISQVKMKGVTDHHRKSFMPIKLFIQNNKSTC